MLTLARAAKRRDVGGEPLPQAFRKLAEYGTSFRRGQVVLLAGEPNVGKSLVMLTACINMGVPTLYISADTDPFTVVQRAAAMITGHTMTSIEEAMAGPGRGFYIEQVESLDHLRFVFDPSPTLDDIDLELMAFEEAWGQAPHLLVIDNLMNVGDDDDGTGMAWRSVLKALHHVARSSGACVAVLHHTSEASLHKTVCPPRRAVQGKINQLPEVILTLGRSGDFMGVATVKNRNGPVDPSGGSPIFLWVDMDRMCLLDDQPASEGAVSADIEGWWATNVD